VTPTTEGGRPATAAPNLQSIPGPNPTRHKQHTCCAHCRACGRCFAGTTGFDAHRQGSHTGPRNSLQGRRCVTVEHDEQQRFERVDGVCRIAGAEERATTIWRLAGAADRAGRDFRQTAPRDLEALAA
jgi:hypothetical protein